MAPALLQTVAFALLAASPTCPTLPPCPQDDQWFYAANEVSFQVSCAMDYHGGDLKLAHISTRAACMNVCSIATGCVAARYVGGNCYMKSTLKAADSNANVIGVAVSSREVPTDTVPVSTPQTCPGGFTCPDNEGCSCTDGSRTLVLSCSMGFYGGDFANQYAESLGACMRTCAANTECVAASFVGGKGAGTCYLKSTKNSGNINDSVNGVYVVTDSAGSSSSITPITSTALSNASHETTGSITASTQITSTTPSIVDVGSSSSIYAGAVSTSIPTATVSSNGPLSSTSALSTDAASLVSQAMATDSTSLILSTTTDVSSTGSTMPSLTASSVSSTTSASRQEIATSVESTMQVASLSTIVPSVTASSTDVTSSTIAATSTTLESSVASPTSVIADGGFEATDSMPWAIRNNAPGALTYNLMDSNSPHGGAQVGSVTYRAGASAYQAWFYQPINLQPSTRYTLSAWVKASSANPGCNVNFYIGSADGNTVLKILASATSGTLKPNRIQSSGFYDSTTTAGAATFSVRLTCSGAASRVYYVDDISLVPS